MSQIQVICVQLKILKQSRHKLKAFLIPVIPFPTLNNLVYVFPKLPNVFL